MPLLSVLRAALRTAVLFALLCLPALAQTTDAFAEAEHNLQTAPKQTLTLARKQLKENPVSDTDRARWLAIASEAAFALALPDAAIKYAKEGMDRPHLTPAMQLRLSLAYALALDLAGRSEESLNELMTVVATLEKGAFEPQLMVDALTARSSAYYSSGNFRAALADLMRVYPMAPEHGERTIRADVATSLANVYAALSDNEHAEKYYLEAIDFSLANQTWVRASIAEYSLATVYSRSKDWQKSATYFERSREHSLLADDGQGVAYAEYGLARVALELKDYDKAERMYLNSRPVFVDAGDVLPQANIDHGLARIAQGRKQYQKALGYIAESLELAKQVTEFDLTYRLLELRADIQATLGNHQAAYLSLQQSGVAKQKWMENRNNDSLSELRVRFDSERQEQQNALLLKENLLSQAKLSAQQQTTRLYVVSVVALLVVLGFLVYLAHRNRQVRMHLAAQALTDELTGVANRRHAMRFLAAEFERARRYKTPLALATLDLDHFKKINDRFGHDAGDEVLKMVASALDGCLRKTDLFGRVGGEEFVAILPHTAATEAMLVLERMRMATLALNCPKLKNEIQPSVSIGLACLSDDDVSVEELLKRSDAAVYAAKQAGRNQVVKG